LANICYSFVLINRTKWQSYDSTRTSKLQVRR